MPPSPASSLREPDLHFVQLCLRAQCDPAAVAMLRAHVSTVAIEWDRVQEFAAMQRLAPLLYQTVRDGAVVPAAVESVWRDSYYATARRNLVLGHELATVLDVLGAAAIPVVVLKGAALVETVYASLAVRPMLDVDLLVRHATVSAVIDTLGRLGYLRSPLEMRTGTVAMYENEILLCKPGRADFDIHWSLFDSPLHQQGLDMEWFWATARPLRIRDTPALMLGPEATVLHLCGHIWLHHGGTALLWLHDVARVIAADPGAVDWAELLQRAQRYQLVMPVQRVLSRVAEAWGVPIPTATLSRLNATQPSADELRTFTALTAAHRSVAQRFWTDLHGMRGWQRRLHFAWTLLFPSAAYMRVRYRIRHPLLVPLYYPYRWARGVRSAL